MINHTHDPSARSWVASADHPDSDFPLQNLPLGVFTLRGREQESPRIGVAIGDQVFDLLQALPLLPALPPEVREALHSPRLNALFALGRPAIGAVRHAVWRLLEAGFAERQRAADALRPQSDVVLHLPCDIGDYTDFFASPNHARNTFNLFRPGQTFLPNFAHLPIAYHGRASSIVPAGAPLRRPWGLVRTNPDALPEVMPTRKLDIELELGFYVGRGNPLGQPVPLNEAEQHLAGVCVLNDWSARDIQAFESQPLGPFQSKNFCSSVAPWVVTLEALAPFRSASAPRGADAPALHAYLDHPADAAAGAFDIRLEASLRTEAMRGRGDAPVPFTRARFAHDVCWTPAQMLAHHTLGGCNLRAGDLLGSGTISGGEPGTEGSLLERTWNGTRPLALPSAESRTFLLDGDEITLTAWCEREGFRRIGLGRCTTLIQSALEAPF